MKVIKVNLFYKRLEFIVYEKNNKLVNIINSNLNIEKSSVNNGAFFFMIKYLSMPHRLIYI